MGRYAQAYETAQYRPPDIHDLALIEVSTGVVIAEVIAVDEESNTYTFAWGDTVQVSSFNDGRLSATAAWLSKSAGALIGQCFADFDTAMEAVEKHMKVIK